MAELTEKRVLIFFITIQVDKKKQVLDSIKNKCKIYNKTLNNNKNTISLVGKLEFFLILITGQHIDVEALHEVVDM